MKYLVSVVVPVYNTEKFLEKCIESLINQTYFLKMEIIIINDGSSDNSLDLIENYSRNFENIIVIDKKNEGLSATRNMGIKLSSAEWIFFIDSDDYIERNMIEKMYKHTINNNYDLCICNLKKIDLHENQIKEVLYKENKSLSKLQAIEEFLNGNIDGYACNKMFKKNLFLNNKIFFPVGKQFEDFSTIFKILTVSNKIGIITDELYYYVQHSMNITKLPKKNAWKDIIDNTVAVNKYLESVGKISDTFIIKQLNLAIYYFWLGNEQEDYKSYIKYSRKLYLRINFNFIINNYKDFMKYLLLNSRYGKRLVTINQNRKEI